MKSLPRLLLLALTVGWPLIPLRLCAGGDNNVAQVVFQLEPEIDCPGCEGRLHDLLGKARGVEKVDINVLTNRIVVRYDAAKCNPVALMGRIRVTGYTASQVK